MPETMAERMATIEALADVAARDRQEMLKTMASLVEKIDALDKKLASYENQARGIMSAGAAFKALALAGWSTALVVGGFLASYGHKISALTGR